MFHNLDSLLSKISRKRKSADEAHLKAMKAIAPLQEKVEAMNVEAKELEALKLEL